MGPKTVRAKTLNRLASVGVRQRTSQRKTEHLQSQADEWDKPESSQRLQNYGAIPLMVMDLYLEIYHSKMYHIWPVVDIHALKIRLGHVPLDTEAYILASSVCAATILQLQLMAEGSGMPSPQHCIDEIELIRNTAQYRRRPTVDSLLTSFFLHISYLHLDQQPVSTLLLREAITMSHLLDLHQPSHYANLDDGTAQAHLRAMWLLFITERWACVSRRETPHKKITDNQQRPCSAIRPSLHCHCFP